jgi:chromosome partitioning protein
MSQASNIFEKFELNGSKALEIFRRRAFNPDTQKSLRTWGINDASLLVGRSRKTIFDLEKENKLPSAEIDAESGRRVYTLKHINFLRNYFGTKPSKPSGSDPAVIAVTNFKGGVWKTTTAINAAHYFALKGYKVLFIDADSQGSGTQCFGYIPDNDIDDDSTLLPYLLGEITTLKPAIRSTYWDGLDLIPANLALYNAEFELPVKNTLAQAEGKSFYFYDILRQGIESIKENYDIIIIDCPPSMGMISINSIYAATSLLIPIPPSMLDFSSTIQFFGMLKDVLMRLPEKEYAFIRLLITKYETTPKTKELVDSIRQLYGTYVKLSTMPNSEAIKKIGMDMLSIYEADKYAGNKKTLDRVRHAADEVNNELEDLIKRSWELSRINDSNNLELVANV